jgi:hypothetical protein
MLNINLLQVNAVSATRFDAHVQGYRAFRRARVEAWFMSAVLLDISDMRAPPRCWRLTEADHGR